MPTNRYGNKKVTKDGQSREMRQRMARGRRARGERGMTSARSPKSVTQGHTPQAEKNMNQLRSVGRDLMKITGRAGTVASVFNQGTSKNDTLESKGMYKGGQKAGPPMPKRLSKSKKTTDKPTTNTTKLSASAKDFDRAFAKARRAGKKTFMWRGKSYNTKLK